MSDSTVVGIGSIDAATNTSTDTATEGHIYIQAANSADGNFTLAKPGDGTPRELVYDKDYGTWTAAAPTSPGTDQILVENFVLASATVPSYESPVELPLNPTFAVNSAENSCMDFIPLDITVNDTPATYEKDEYDCYIYTVDRLPLIAEVIANKLSIVTTEGSFSAGSYHITVTVPGKYSASGEELTSSATLTITGENDSIAIPIPQAISGLKYTGSEQVGVPEGVGYSIEDNTGINAGEYTATVTLVGNYTWSDGTPNNPIKIPWSIQKAAGPAAPTWLGVAAPSAAGSSDGKITGTTGQMEYSDNEDFTDAEPCQIGETTGLAAGTYYVRIIPSDTANYENGEPAVIVIPDAVTNSAIAVNSTAHKTAYFTGDALDVAGLSIQITRSDGSTRTMAVTEGMVSGFDSSKVGGQSLTITYDNLTTTYEINVEEAYSVEVMDSYATTSGAGRYRAGATVQISAGQRSGYTFSGWTSTDGVNFADAGSATTTFSMPAKAVSVTATWKSTDSDPQPAEYTVNVETLAEVPEGLKGTSFDTVDKIKNELIRILTANPAYTENATAVYDVKLQISTDGGKTWADATEENFPPSGITVVIPYPSGTGKDTHDFFVTHMFTIDSKKLGTVAGQTEQPAVTKTDKGIKVTLKGLSPVGVAWKEVSNSSTDNSGSKNNNSNSSNSNSKNISSANDNSSSGSSTSSGQQQTGSPNTGDSTHLGLWLCITCILAVAIIAFLVFKWRGKEKDRKDDNNQIS